MTSIIIPAHNEASVIRATLTTLVEGLDVANTEVLVVCNGCSDETAAEARIVAGPIQVLEIDQASKTEALNLGDSAASSYPRIYLDADVEISGTSISYLVSALQSPGVLAAEPTPRVDTSQSSLIVKAYYDVYLALHGQQAGDVGGGVYAMSHNGRGRFETFPGVIADDAYARAHFGSGELMRISDASSVVYAPAGAVDLLQIKTRSRLGILELHRDYPELWAHKRSHTNSLVDKARSLPIRIWPSVPVYVVLQLLARWRAKRLLASLDSYRWQRDDSSRGRSDDTGQT